MRCRPNGNPKDDMLSNCYLDALPWLDMLSRSIKGDIKAERQQRRERAMADGNNPEYSGGNNELWDCATCIYASHIEAGDAKAQYVGNEAS